MKRILAMTALGLLLAGCVYSGPGPGYYSSGYSQGGYYGGAYGGAGYPGPGSGEFAASPS